MMTISLWGIFRSILRILFPGSMRDADLSGTVRYDLAVERSPRKSDSDRVKRFDYSPLFYVALAVGLLSSMGIVGILAVAMIYS
jgi:hypothetical protein